jgi:hypothetical protein
MLFSETTDGAATVEHNKNVATELFARFSANDIPGVLDLLTDDATWWIAGKPGLAPVSGVKTKAQMARLFDNMFAQLKSGLAMTVKGLVAEGDGVAAEVESYGELKSGRVYNQEYHTLITVRGNQISAVKEYLDTHHVVATFFQT